ncbi:MAG: mandelate racemase/muconate lactonizing enzyme family protein [Armatimonadota bacterium]|nr:mandelate racemase/muconate lactonizing enzyme family protein [Armatimonadota bacterium]
MSIAYEDALNRVNPYSIPSQLRITDLRVTEIAGAPMRCGLIKLYTNQGLVGLGEVRDAGSKTYALMLKSRLLGQNPCHVDRLFRRIKQFGGHGRQGGGVSGVEVALWDLAGKAYGVPVCQMLGGRFRDRIRLYCDTDARGKVDGAAMGEALNRRLQQGFTFLKMDLGLSQVAHSPGSVSAPLGLLDEMTAARRFAGRARPTTLEEREARHAAYERWSVPHPFTGIQLTEKGLDLLEEYAAQVRQAIGPEVPLAIDHLGHMNVESAIRLARRLEKVHPAWLEDAVPWQFTEQYVLLRRATTIPICTGEDIYLKEGFRPLLERGGVSVVHPDVLTAGGILETKKIGDLAQEYGVAMAIHMAESPVGCLAAAHVAAATENFLALEFHSADIPWWENIALGVPKPIVCNGWIEVPDRPGLGIDDLNDEVLREHLAPGQPGLWPPSDQWDHEWSHDRTWS